MKKIDSSLSNKELLTKIIYELNEVKAAQKSHEDLLQKIAGNHVLIDTRTEPESASMFLLPFSLRKTIKVLLGMERATAADLAKQTKRLRAVESAAANQLVRLGYLKKTREGRTIYFSIERSALKTNSSNQ